LIKNEHGGYGETFYGETFCGETFCGKTLTP